MPSKQVYYTPFTACVTYRCEAYVAFFFGCLAYVFWICAFCSPFWLESYPQTHSKFVRIGLWEACFSGFSHYSDDRHTEHWGCKLLYSKDFWWIREWLLPPWFICVIVFSILATVALSIAFGSQAFIFYQAAKHESYRGPTLLYQLAAIPEFVGCVLLIIVAIIFGVGRNDWNWMPKPDWNYLSWSYWLLCMSLCLAFLSSIIVWAGPLRESQSSQKNRSKPLPATSTYPRPAAGIPMQSLPRGGGAYQQAPGGFASTPASQGPMQGSYPRGAPGPAHYGGGQGTMGSYGQPSTGGGYGGPTTGSMASGGGGYGGPGYPSRA